MKYEQAFKKFKEKFTGVDVSELDDMALQITLSDEDCGGTFYAELKNHILSVEPYDYKDNDAVIDVSRAALNSILDGKTTIDEAIENGELTVHGELAKLHGLTEAVQASVKKAKTERAKRAAATRAANKEAEAKKAAEEAEAKAKQAVEAKVKKAPAKKAAVKKTPAKKSAAKKTSK